MRRHARQGAKSAAKPDAYGVTALAITSMNTPFVPLLTLNVRQLISPPPQLLCATQGLADYQAKLSNAKDDYERASAQIGIEVCSAMNHALGNV
mmetsp:Transcript_22906/g.56761  ORF Transcript_22906/g.56761 Transcript_22906/m.56761 type:complete len:94 (+) Transcript_22906:827-1108(+)